MALIDDLKKKREERVARKLEREERITDLYEEVAGYSEELRHLDIAIAALSPAPAESREEKLAPMTFGCDGRYDGGVTGFSFKTGETMPEWMLGADYHWESQDDGTVVVTGPKQSAGAESREEVEIPAGFTRWSSDPCADRGPQPSGDMMVIGWMGGDDFVGPIPAKDFHWHHDTDPVLGYKIVSSGQLEAVATFGDEAACQTPSPAGVEESQDQSLYTDADAGLEPGNLTPAEIDAATAELFDRAGELDGLTAADFAPVVAVDDVVFADSDFTKRSGETLVAQYDASPPTNPEADERAKAMDWYSPENVAERNKFDPFRMFKREDA